MPKLKASAAPAPSADEQASLVGTRLAQLRRARRMRQAEAAQLAGLSRPTASRIEAGDPGRTLDQVLRYLRALSPETSLLQLLQLPDNEKVSGVQRVRVPGNPTAAAV